MLKVVRGVAAYVSGRIAKLAPDAIRLETPAAIVGVRGTTARSSRRGGMTRSRGACAADRRRCCCDRVAPADRSVRRARTDRAATRSSCCPTPTPAPTGRATVSNGAASVELAAPAPVHASSRSGQAAVAGNRPERGRGAPCVRRRPLRPAAGAAHFTLYFKFESDELTDESRALVPRFSMRSRRVRSPKS